MLPCDSIPPQWHIWKNNPGQNEAISIHLQKYHSGEYEGALLRYHLKGWEAIAMRNTGSVKDSSAPDTITYRVLGHLNVKIAPLSNYPLFP